jgi:hypothetical protein
LVSFQASAARSGGGWTELAPDAAGVFHGKISDVKCDGDHSLIRIINDDAYEDVVTDGATCVAIDNRAKTGIQFCGGAEAEIQAQEISEEGKSWLGWLMPLKHFQLVSVLKLDESCKAPWMK